MISPNRLLKVTLGLLSGIFVAACCQVAPAALITFEPDDYADGTMVNTIEPGVLLRLYDSILDDLEPPAITPIEALSDIHPSTGDQVFGRNSIASFSDTRQLDMTFAALTDFVSIDFIGSSSIAPEVGKLEIYNSIGTLLGTYTTAALAANQIETMSFTRLTPDVKFARAYTAPGLLPFGRLDNLKFQKYAVIPEPMTVVLVGVAVVLACGMRRGTR